MLLKSIDVMSFFCVTTVIKPGNFYPISDFQKAIPFHVNTRPSPATMAKQLIQIVIAGAQVCII